MSISCLNLCWKIADFEAIEIHQFWTKWPVTKPKGVILTSYTPISVSMEIFFLLRCLSTMITYCMSRPRLAKPIKLICISIVLDTNLFHPFEYPGVHNIHKNFEALHCGTMSYIARFLSFPAPKSFDVLLKLPLWVLAATLQYTLQLVWLPSMARGGHHGPANPHKNSESSTLSHIPPPSTRIRACGPKASCQAVSF